MHYTRKSAQAPIYLNVTKLTNKNVYTVNGGGGWGVGGGGSIVQDEQVKQHMMQRQANE